MTEEARLPSEGGRLEIEFSLRRDEPEHHFVSIHDETEEGWIASPLAEDPVFQLKPGTRIFGRFTVGAQAFEFDSICLASATGNLPLFYLLKPIPAEIRRRQMRSFARVDCEIPAQVTRHEKEADVPLSGMIRNISGGGALIESLAPFSTGELLRLKFTIPGQDDPLTGIVAKVVKEVPGSEGAKVFVLHFEGIDEATRSEIIRFTFELQRRLRRKGKI